MCVECPGSDSWQTIIQVIITTVAVALLTKYLASVSDKVESVSLEASVAGTIIQHIQLFGFSLAFNVSPPVWFVKLWAYIASFVSFSIGASCMCADSGRHRIMHL